MVSKATLRASACPSLRICAAVGFLGLGRLERVEGAGEETEAVALPLRLRRVAEDEASATASDESEEGGAADDDAGAWEDADATTEGAAAGGEAAGGATEAGAAVTLALEEESTSGAWP
jgi:hypothetical protein